MFGWIIVGKLIVYSALCIALVPLFRMRVANFVYFALSWGALRLLMGFALGIPILLFTDFALAKGFSPDWAYVLAFGGTRIVAWTALFAAIARRHELAWGSKSVAWIAAGIAVSMVSDWLMLLTGLDDVKFVC